MNAVAQAPVDAALPSLAALFDLDAMQARFARRLAALAGVPLSIVSCDIERTKYRPGRNCVVAYRLQVRRGASTATRCVRMTVAVHAHDEGGRRFDAARASWAAGEGSHGPACDWLDDVGAMLWQFPFDRKLPAMRDLADTSWLKDVELPRLASGRLGADWNVTAMRLRGISYFPEHAYTIRARVRLRSKDAKRGRLWTVYGKVRDDESGARCFAAMRELAASEACRRGELGMAAPLDYDAERRILWQEGLEAPTLEWCTARSGMRIGWHRIGIAVAALHRQPLTLPVRLGVADIAAELDRAEDRVRRALPREATALEALVARLMVGVDRVATEPVGTVHGDLHSRNVLIGADRAFLIDLDRIATGSAFADLGSLLAEIAFRDCVAARPLREDAFRAVLAAYAERVPWTLDARAVAWHTAAALVRERAYRCVGSLKPGRLAAVPAIIRCAATLLDRGVPGLPLRAVATIAVPATFHGPVRRAAPSA